MGFSDFILSNYDPKTGRRYFQDPNKQAMYDERWKFAKSGRLDDKQADTLALTGMVFSSNTTTKAEIIRQTSEKEQRRRDEESRKNEQKRYQCLIDENKQNLESEREQIQYELAEIESQKKEVENLLCQIKLEKMTLEERKNYEKEVENKRQEEEFENERQEEIENERQRKIIAHQLDLQRPEKKVYRLFLEQIEAVNVEKRKHEKHLKCRTELEDISLHSEIFKKAGQLKSVCDKMLAIESKHELWNERDLEEYPSRKYLTRKSDDVFYLVKPIVNNLPASVNRDSVSIYFNCTQWRYIPFLMKALHAEMSLSDDEESKILVSELANAYQIKPTIMNQRRSLEKSLKSTINTRLSLIYSLCFLIISILFTSLFFISIPWFVLNLIYFLHNYYKAIKCYNGLKYTIINNTQIFSEIEDRIQTRANNYIKLRG